MGTFTTFKNDEALEQSGIILDYGSAGKFTVARAGGANKAFTRKLKRLTQPYRRAIQNNTMDDKVAEAVLMKAFVDTCLLGWEGVTGSDGEPLEFNRENAMMLLEALPELWAELREDSQNSSMYRQEIREADSGN